MSELQRLKSLLPPENESWVFIEAAAAIDPPLITLEEIGRDEVEIQIDLEEWDNFAIDHRNLLFWHEVGKIQNDTIPRDGWEMAALAIGLGGAIGELWVQDGLLLLLALGLSSFAGYRLYLKNNSEKKLQDAIFADERAISPIVRESSAKRDLVSLNQLMRFLGSTKAVHEITYKDIEGSKGLIQHLQNNGYKDSGINITLRHIKTFLNWLYEKEKLIPERIKFKMIP